jgi:hypothetical protein
MSGEELEEAKARALKARSVRLRATAAMLVGSPLALIAFLTAVEAIEFVRTGMCPAEPLDIPARHCSAAEFVDSSFSGWELMGSWMIVVTWVPVGTLLGVSRWATGALLERVRERRMLARLVWGLLSPAAAVTLLAWVCLVTMCLGFPGSLVIFWSITLSWLGSLWLERSLHTRIAST